MRQITKWLLAIFATVSMAVMPVGPAIAMTVQPVILDLQTSGRGVSQIVTVKNTFETPLPVELTAEFAEFDDSGLKATGQATEDLIIFPPQAIIEPGRTQSFRVQYVGDPALLKSRHYFVTVAQLPVELPDTQSAVQILYNFQVIVSVAAPGKKPNLTVASASASTEGDGQPRVLLNLQNDADTYGYLSKGSLRIVQRDDSGKEVFRRTLNPAEITQLIGFGLVGAGRQRRMLTPIVLPMAGGSVEAEFIQGRS